MAPAAPTFPTSVPQPAPRRGSVTQTLLRRVRRDTSVKLHEPAIADTAPLAPFTVRVVEGIDDARFGPRLEVDVTIELVGEGALELAEDLEVLGVGGRSQLVLNLAQVYRIDGSGFVALTRLYGALLRRGITLCIAHPQPIVRRRLLSSGLHLVVPVEG